MNRKYGQSKRTNSTTLDSFRKQNGVMNHCNENLLKETVNIDAKIKDIKKKYHQEAQLQIKTKCQENFISKFSSSGFDTINQQMVVKKLENLRKQLQEIPDWENVAKSVLFGEKTSLRMSSHSKKLSIQNSNKIKPFQLEESVILKSSNVSFNVQEAYSNQKFSEKKYKHYVPNTKVKQFSADRNRHSKQSSRTLELSHEKINDKIDEIERKIKQTQLKKKKLGVDFIPFERKHYKNQSQEIRTRALGSSYGNISILEKTFSEANRNISTDTISPRFAIPEAPYVESIKKNYQNASYQANLQRNQNKQLDGLSKSVSMNKKYCEHKIDWSQTQQAIKQRKKKLLNFEEKKKKKEETGKIVQAFLEQVRLDQKFRNCKLWFKTCKNDKKLQRLKSLLDTQGFTITLQKLEKDLQVQQKQDNPFFSVSNQTCDIELVANSFVQSEKNWKNNIFRKFNKKYLQQQDFNNNTLDLERKGYIALEDLVRFLNMETGTFFRNRDLFAIFRRLNGNNDQLNFTYFIGILCE